MTQKHAIWVSFLLFVWASTNAGAEETQLPTVPIISLGTITQLARCTGDTLVVPYTATGAFNAGNKFRLQLSDPTGSFTQFTYVGLSAQETDSIVLQISTPGDHYRVRVIGTDPFVTSSDNGFDIKIATHPQPFIGTTTKHAWYGGLGTYDSVVMGLAGEGMTFTDLNHTGTAILWKFSPDAFPETSTLDNPTITFLNAGIKRGFVIFRNSDGCTTTDSFTFRVLNCTPTLPTSALIVTGDTSGRDPLVLVKAGGSYRADPNYNQFPPQTIFVESGGAASVRDAKVTCYVKAGGTVTYLGSQGAVVLMPGATVTCWESDRCDTFMCPNLSFGSLAVAQQEDPAILLHISSNHLIASSEAEITLDLFDLLGRKILLRSGTDHIDVDLSAVETGIYFAEARTTSQVKMQRVAVIH